MNFEEQFPSLRDRGNQHTEFYKVFHQIEIESFCLDKAKVKEAIENMEFFFEPGCDEYTLNEEKTKKELLKELWLEK